MRLLFICCNGGHLFRKSKSCPYDGWSHTDVELVLETFENNPNINHDDLIALGVDKYLLDRVIFIESSCMKCLISCISIQEIKEFDKEAIKVDGLIDFIPKLNKIK